MSSADSKKKEEEPTKTALELLEEDDEFEVGCSASAFNLL
jgi:hypothetical protein